MSAGAFQRFCDATARIYESQFPAAVGESVRKIVAARGVEPREGFVVNELAVALSNGVEVALEGRGRGAGIPIVRWNGEVVAHGSPLNPIFKPEREWLNAINAETERIWQDEMHVKALPGCVECHGFGVVTDEGEYVACGCTERRETSFAVIHGANQSEAIFNDVAERLAA